MKIPAKKLEDRSSVMMKSVPSEQIIQQSNVECWADVYCDNVYMSARHSFDEKFANRPYLVLSGECRAIRGDMPCGVNEISFAEGKGIAVTYFYEFTDAEIAQLATKGLFHTGFKTPVIFDGNKFELPAVCNIKVVAPEVAQDVPIVYTQIVNQHCMSITEETCGYGLAEYFEQQIFEDEVWNEPENVYVNEESKTLEEEVTVAEQNEKEVAPEAEPVAEEPEVEEVPTKESSDEIDAFVADNYAEVKAEMNRKFNPQPDVESEPAEEDIPEGNDGHMPAYTGDDFVGDEAEREVGD